MTTTAAPVVPTVDFHDRTMPVQPPDDGQYAILIEAERWMTKAIKERDKLDLSTDLPDDHPDTVKARQLTEISKAHVGRLFAVLGSLFLDQDHWDFIRDGLADRTITREEVFSLPAQIIRACHDAAQPEPANRAERRTTAKRGRRTA